MKTLYLDCGMGAAGDMLTAALLELTDQTTFLNTINSLGLSDMEITAKNVTQYNITGTQMAVKFQGIEEESQDIKGNSLPEQMPKNVKPAPQRSVSEIENLIKKLKVSEKVISDTLAVYRLLAEAEGAVHGRNVTEIHFCSLGTMDAIADILSVSLLLEMITPKKIIASPVCVGYGYGNILHNGRAESPPNL